MASNAMPRPSDKWIPWYIVLFFVAQSVVLGSFAYIAQKTHTGTVTDGAYQKGLAYNSIIEKSRAQDALGYQSRIEMDAAGTISFSLSDKAGSPVDATHVAVWFFRPTQAAADVHAVMRPKAAGIYTIKPALPAKGLWEVRVHAETPKGSYQAIKRVVMP